MQYTINLKASAEKALLKLPDDIARRIEKAIDRLASVPRPTGVKKLKGAVDLYRIRVGEYRIIYQIKDKIITLVVLRIGHRRGIYRKT